MRLDQPGTAELPVPLEIGEALEELVRRVRLARPAKLARAALRDLTESRELLDRLEGLDQLDPKVIRARLVLQGCRERAVQLARQALREGRALLANGELPAPPVPPVIEAILG